MSHQCPTEKVFLNLMWSVSWKLNLEYVKPTQFVPEEYEKQLLHHFLSLYALKVFLQFKPQTQEYLKIMKSRMFFPYKTGLSQM
jgi:hypothetical protein